MDFIHFDDHANINVFSDSHKTAVHFFPSERKM